MFRMNWGLTIYYLVVNFVKSWKEYELKMIKINGLLTPNIYEIQKYVKYEFR